MRCVPMLLALLGLAAALPDAEVARRLRAGGAAFDQADYAAALRLFEEVEPFADEPGRATFNLATARFRLALQGGEDAAKHLAEAITLYRCTIEPGDPRRDKSLVGLGGCLLLQASRGRSHAACDEALKVLEAAVKAEPTGDLAKEARRLLHRARLLEWQLLPGPNDRQPEPPPGEPEKQPGEKEKKVEPGPSNKDGGMKQQGGTKAVPTTDPGGKGQDKKDGPQGSQAAEGNPPAVQDRDALPPGLDAAEARRQLREATRLIQAEQKVFRRTTTRPPAEGVPDW